MFNGEPRVNILKCEMLEPNADFFRPLSRTGVSLQPTAFLRLIKNAPYLYNLYRVLLEENNFPQLPAYNQFMNDASELTSTHQTFPTTSPPTVSRFGSVPRPLSPPTGYQNHTSPATGAGVSPTSLTPTTAGGIAQPPNPIAPGLNKIHHNVIPLALLDLIKYKGGAQPYGEGRVAHNQTVNRVPTPHPYTSLSSDTLLSTALTGKGSIPAQNTEPHSSPQAPEHAPQQSFLARQNTLQPRTYGPPASPIDYHQHQLRQLDTTSHLRISEQTKENLRLIVAARQSVAAAEVATRVVTPPTISTPVITTATATPAPTTATTMTTAATPPSASKPPTTATATDEGMEIGYVEECVVVTV